MNRVWRTLAIEWFDAMEREIGSHFTRSFFAELHRVLNIGTEEEVRSVKSERERTLEDAHIFFGIDAESQSAMFVFNSETVFIALCNLALEDFK